MTSIVDALVDLLTSHFVQLCMWLYKRVNLGTLSILNKHVWKQVRKWVLNSGYVLIKQMRLTSVWFSANSLVYAMSPVELQWMLPSALCFARHSCSLQQGCYSALGLLYCMLHKSPVPWGHPLLALTFFTDTTSLSPTHDLRTFSVCPSIPVR